MGTILPDPIQMVVVDRHAERLARHRELVGDRRLAGCTKRIVGGEVRWYDTTDQYAIVSRRGDILWFAVTPQGDFRI